MFHIFRSAVQDKAVFILNLLSYKNITYKTKPLFLSCCTRRIFALPFCLVPSYFCLAGVLYFSVHNSLVFSFVLFVLYFLLKNMDLPC